MVPRRFLTIDAFKSSKQRWRAVIDSQGRTVKSTTVQSAPPGAGRGMGQDAEDSEEGDWSAEDSLTPEGAELEKAFDVASTVGLMEWSKEKFSAMSP